MVAQVPQDDIRETIVRFVETSAQPVLFMFSVMDILLITK